MKVTINGKMSPKLKMNEIYDINFFMLPSCVSENPKVKVKVGIIIINSVKALFLTSASSLIIFSLSTSLQSIFERSLILFPFPKLIPAQAVFYQFRNRIARRSRRSVCLSYLPDQYAIWPFCPPATNLLLPHAMALMLL